MQNQDFVCADCGKRPPPTEEGETITRQHGWRITRTVVAGITMLEARCRECHARYRTSLPPTTKRGPQSP